MIDVSIVPSNAEVRDLFDSISCGDDELVLPG